MSVDESGSAGAASSVPGVQWFATWDVGPTRKALDQALADRDLAGFAAVTAELARGAAELTDSARRAQDARLWLASSARLLDLLGRLGVRPAGDGAAGGDPGPVDGQPDELESALGAGPQVGD